jgi:hypothetical protein
LLEAARPLGKGYQCRLRLPDGTLDETIISKEEAAALASAGPAVEAKVPLADAEQLPLLIESARIRLAYAHDPALPSLSGIRTLAHEIEAVCLKMLPQPRLRFLLADDPGAGKTINYGWPVHQRTQAPRSHRTHTDPLPGTADNPVPGRNAPLVW